MLEKVGIPAARIHGPAPVRPPSRPTEPAGTAESGFQAELEQALSGSQVSPAGLKFSAHAQQRLALRGIQLTEPQLAQLGRAVDQVAAKGGTESLVLMQDAAFVVSVPNRTIITAVTGATAREGVFTNIDSAVIVPGARSITSFAAGITGLDLSGNEEAPGSLTD